MAVFNRAQVVAEVHSRIEESIVKDMVKYVKGHKKKLMGRHQFPEHDENMVYGTLMKDLFHKAFNWLRDNTDFGYSIANETWTHNVRRVRFLLREWALERHLELGTPEDWDASAQFIRVPKKLQDMNLWADSTDVRVQKRKNLRGPKSDTWSGKMSKPGQRFMCLQDGEGYIVKMFGVYSPKVYDSHFMEYERTYFEEHLKGGVILADQHFSSASHMFTDPKIYTTSDKPKQHSKKEDVKKTGKKRKKKEMEFEDEDDDLGLAFMTKEEEAHKRDIESARGAVEAPFGHIKGRFQTLRFAWAEELEQLRNVVIYAAGVHNLILRRNEERKALASKQPRKKQRKN